jgi:hypothetical protein
MFYLKEKSTVVYSRIFLELFWLFQIVPLASVGISVEEKKMKASHAVELFFSRGTYTRRLVHCCVTCASLIELFVVIN